MDDAPQALTTAGVVVSVIVPIYNASAYLSEALVSIERQTYRPLEVVFWDDASTDDSLALVSAWSRTAKDGIAVIVGGCAVNGGPGFARNSAIGLSTGSLLAHFDADDVMRQERIAMQVQLFLSLPLSDRDLYLIGSNFDRLPEDSTPYYTQWLNDMSQEDLVLQQFRECTIICPTWCYSRTVFDRIAKHRQTPGKAFVESSPAVLAALNLSRVPEDLYFFLDHLLLRGKLRKVVGDPLLTYRYSPAGWTLGSKKQDLQRVRAFYLEAMVLSTHAWQSFQVWGSGKDGRKFLKLVSRECAARVSRFLEVDEAKIGTKYFCRETGRHIPIVHYKDASDAPIIICVASKRAGGDLEKNVASLNLREGVHFLHFC